ncbi:BTB/POZ domain-containing protein At3g56230-like [Salvia hispanica]|uniref:BTB/POZ domain-containing protein At3g56230-like n=1 Tax=Salvia hispanica TaxID=49212 RepID=UPI0020099BF1|nr:BTB/POZ domain-containing protein At3g56230-like [Salvia hispanica]
MSCCFCNANTYDYGYGYGQLTICLACFEGGKSIILLTNKPKKIKTINNDSFSPSSSNKGFVKALKWMKLQEEKIKLEDEKMTYLSGFATALKDQIHTDIQVMSGDNKPPIPAHRGILATRSTIFRNMLDSDQCKAPANQTITLSELNHEELEALLEFLYSGSLPKEKMEKLVCPLALAADKYEIPFLQKFCHQVMLGSLKSSNALDILEISDTCNNKNLKETALSFIVRNMEEIVFSPGFDDFALKNHHLHTQITRASLTNKKRKIGA